MFLFGSKIQASLPILIQSMHSTEINSARLKPQPISLFGSTPLRSLLRRLPPAVSSPTLTTRVARFSEKQDLRWYCKLTSSTCTHALRSRPHACMTQPKVFSTAQKQFSTKFEAQLGRRY